MAMADTAPATAAEPVTILDMTGEQLGELDGVALPPTLVELHLSHNRLKRIDHLAALTQLAVLVLRGNLIERIEGLDACAALRELDLYENQLSEIRGLEALRELRSLDISFNSIRSLVPLRAPGLASLEKLFAPQNKIELIEGLNGLARLNTLELGSNRIRRIQNIGHLSELRELHLGRNKIAALSGLSGLSNLKILGLSSNRLTSLGAELADLHALEELYLAHNGLLTFDDLPRSLSRLRLLDVAGNSIADVCELGGWPQLEDLWLNDNKIPTLAAAGRLASSPALQTLYIEGNPLVDSPAYVEKVLAFAPTTLRQLDALTLAADWVAKVARAPAPQPPAGP
jgi:protein phosphatase 1 regulatory subunit 7